MQDHWSKVHQDMRAIYEKISAPEKDEKSAATGSGTEEQSKVRIREAIYKIRTLAKKQGKPLSRAYQEYIANSSLSPAEKAKVKAKVMGTSEEYVYHMESLQFDEQTGQYKVRVTESNSGKIFVRTISLQKVHELRSMPDSYNFATEAKKLDPVGQEDGDIDNDGDEDENDKYLKKRRKAIGKAIENQKEDLEVHEDLMKETLDRMEEGVRDLDPEKGTKERKARLEKKRGMKLDDHPQYKKEEVENVDEMIDPKGAARIDSAKKKKKVDVFAYDRKLQAQGKLKGKKLPPPPTNESAVPGKPAEKLGAVTAISKDAREAAKQRLLAKAAAKRASMKKEEVENVEELYKGKHGQSEKEYADSRSPGGKMVSGDSKGSGAEYTHGRRVKAANSGMQPDVGGKTKPKSQGKMDRGTRADLQYRKANLKKEEVDLKEKAPETDKQGLDKFDRYKRMIRHKQDKYGRASVMDKIRTGKDYKTEDVETPFGDMKSMVKRAIKRIDANVDGSVDEKDLKNPNEMGEFVPTPDGNKKTTRVKEGYSWRNDLIEVMGDKLDDDSKKKIDVMKGKNTVNINPKEEVDLSDSLETVVEEEGSEKKYCRLCKKKETKSQCGFGPKMWEKYSVDDASEKEVENAAGEGGVSEALSVKDQMRISQEYNRKSPEERKAAVQRAMSKHYGKKTAPKKDTRTDDEKMADATGPRKGSRYRGD